MTIHDTLWQPRPVCTDARLRHWLIDRGSLTRRLQSRCPQFGVDLLSQRLAAPCRDEYEVLALGAREQCVVREVALKCGREPIVFAHSVALRQTVDTGWQLLRALGARPLGAVLFANPRVQRGALHFQRLNPRHVLYQRACTLVTRPPVALWARRSLFILGKSRLLVTEVFLPAILALAP